MFLTNLFERLHEALYRNQLALDYLYSRRVTEGEIKLYKIGYSRVVSAADDGSDDFKNFMDETHRARDLENKIIFPIYDILGNPAGLLGRAIETKEFKLYITLEGKFTGVLFGLPQALPSIYETGRVFTVEGPFDLLAFRKVYPNVVSTLTAELTESQYLILDLFARDIVTVFDSDGPGRAGAERAKKRWPLIKTACLGWKDPDAGLKILSLKDYVKNVQSRINAVLPY